jgi:phage shock protein PspC (stress-responsive transcriptional regulator)
MIGRPRGFWVIVGLLLFATVAITLYWIAWFFIPNSVQASNWECYIVFEQAFPLADAWLAIAALIGAIGLWRRKDWGFLFGLLAGGAAIFLGLMDLLYDLEHGTFAQLTSESLIELVIVVLVLALGPVVITYLWTRRRQLGLGD